MANKHLIEDDADAPPVALLRVALPQQHLQGPLLRGSGGRQVYLPQVQCSWECRRGCGRGSAGARASSGAQAASSRGWRRRGTSTGRSPGPGCRGPSSPADCGLGIDGQTLHSIIDLNCLTVEYLSIVLVVFAVVGPPEAGAQAKVRQLDVPIRV